MIAPEKDQKLRRKQDHVKSTYGYNYCHHCSKLTITDDLICCSNISCGLLYCYKGLHRYNIPRTKQFGSKACLVCQDRCMGDSCNKASIKEDFGLMALLVEQYDEINGKSCPKNLEPTKSAPKIRRREQKLLNVAKDKSSSKGANIKSKAKQTKPNENKDANVRYNMASESIIIDDDQDDLDYKRHKLIDIDNSADQPVHNNESGSYSIEMHEHSEYIKDGTPFGSSTDKEEPNNNLPKEGANIIEIDERTIESNKSGTLPIENNGGWDFDLHKTESDKNGKVGLEPTRRSARSKHVAINGSNFCNILAQNTGNLYAEENLNLEKMLYKDENEYLMSILESQHQKPVHRRRKNKVKHPN